MNSIYENDCLTELEKDKLILEAYFGQSYESIDSDDIIDAAAGLGLTVDMIKCHMSDNGIRYILESLNFTGEEILSLGIEKLEPYNCWHYTSTYGNLSEEFIEIHQDKIDWNSVFEHQTLSSTFIDRHRNKVSLPEVIKYQSLTEEQIEALFLETFSTADIKHYVSMMREGKSFPPESSQYCIFTLWSFVSRYQKLSEAFIDKHRGSISWPELHRVGVNLSYDFQRRYRDKLDFKTLVTHQQVPEDILADVLDASIESGENPLIDVNREFKMSKEFVNKYHKYISDYSLLHNISVGTELLQGINWMSGSHYGRGFFGSDPIFDPRLLDEEFLKLVSGRNSRPIRYLNGLDEDFLVENIRFIEWFTVEKVDDLNLISTLLKYDSKLLRKSSILSRNDIPLEFLMEWSDYLEMKSILISKSISKDTKVEIAKLILFQNKF